MSLVLALHLLAASVPAVEDKNAPTLPGPSSQLAIPSTAPVGSSWYGWQPLLFDTAAIGIGLSAVYTRDNVSLETRRIIIGSAIAPWVLGGPTVHLFHGRPIVAAISLAFRVLGPGVLGGGAYLLWHGTGGGGTYLSWDNGIILGVVLGSLGGIAALIVDEFALSWEPVPAAPARPATALLEWVPFAGVVHGAPVAGLAGTF